MEALAAQIHATQTVETGSLTLAVATERDRRCMVSWHEALKALAHRASPPESYIQMASTAVAVGDPEASQSVAQRLLDLTPRLFTTQQRVRVPKRTFNPHRKPRKKANSIPCPVSFTSNRKPRQSICMIVKNEQRLLGQCLTSVKDIADELIVIDTGSIDRTIELAREHGAQVGDFEWCDDFAAARNASIATAADEWILFLDADEKLNPVEKQNLPALLNGNNVALIRLPLINTHQYPISKSILPRLYRNILTQTSDLSCRISGPPTSRSCIR